MTRIRLCDLAWPSFLRTPRARSRPLYLFISLSLFPSYLVPSLPSSPHTRIYLTPVLLLYTQSRFPVSSREEKVASGASEGNNNNYGGRDRFASRRTEKILFFPEEITAEMCKIKDRWRTRREKKKYISNIGRLLYRIVKKTVSLVQQKFRSRYQLL